MEIRKHISQSHLAQLPAAADAKLRRWRSLRHLGKEALDAGRLADAFDLAGRVLEIAHEIGDQGRIDHSVCNRSAVAIALGQQREVFTELRCILLRNDDNRNCFLAAYNLSLAHERENEFKKALFYGRIAHNFARRIGSTEWLAWSHNQLGNSLIGDSCFEEAANEYENALGILPAGRSITRANVQVNLGYCRTMLGDVREGFRLAFKSLRWYRALGVHTYRAWPHLDLCYAYLEASRVRYAIRHGKKALAMGEQAGDQQVVRSALFLLGETAKATGDLETAFSYTSRLQRDFYPEMPNLLEVLSTVPMRQVVNLRA